MNDLAYDYRIEESPPYEIIEGVKNIMAAARPFPHHITIANRLFSIFENYIERNNIRAATFVECDVYLPDEKNVFIPDVTVFCDIDNIEKDSAIHGVPDLVIEVLSRSTMKNDVGIKKNIYERNGVKEYWVINPWSKTVEVYHLIEGKFELDNVYQVFTEKEFERLEENEKAEVKYDIPVSIFEDLTIDVRKIFKWWGEH